MTDLHKNAARTHIDKRSQLVSAAVSLAHQNGFDWRIAGLVFLAVVIPATILTSIAPAALSTRLVMAVSLTAMPIFFVFYNTGRLQIDFHMYFFVVFAMLAAFCRAVLATLVGSMIPSLNISPYSSAAAL